MNNLPFDKPGRFWRGNLHTHSTASDGAWSPEAVCDFYRVNGYDFVAITDHFLEHYDFPVTDTQNYRTDTFTTLVGAELHAGKTEHGQLWHILAVGLPLDFAPPTKDETGPQIAQRAVDAGAYVAVAHPQWYTLTENDVLSLGDVHAIEVFNGTAIDHNDRVDSWYMMDLMLARGRHYTACATDDAHFRPERADAITGWVYVKANECQPESLLESLKRGWYYSSTGPQIHGVTQTEDEVMVRCSPAERVFITGAGHNSVSVHGRGITEAHLPLRSFRSPYARVTVRDANNQRAWSNPFTITA